MIVCLPVLVYLDRIAPLVGGEAPRAIFPNQRAVSQGSDAWRQGHWLSDHARSRPFSAFGVFRLSGVRGVRLMQAAI